MDQHSLYLQKLEDTDLTLLELWLHKPYILRWYEDPEAWLDEIRQRQGAFAFIHHFIAMSGGEPVGFCQYYDCYAAGEDWYSVSTPGETYSVDYLIGEESHLRKGCGKQIIQLLLETIRGETQAKEVIVQPDEENLPSCRALIACGFAYDEALAYYRLRL